MRTFRFLLPLFFSVSMLMLAPSCRLLKHDPKKAAEQKQAKEQKKVQAEYEKAKKAHIRHQSREARKMMKRTHKKAERFNRPFIRKGLRKRKCTS